MPKLTNEQIATLKETHQRIAVVQSEDTKDDGSPEWEVVLRRPTASEYKRCKAYALDDKRRATINEWLFRTLCVFPEGEGIESLIEEWPAIYDGCLEAMNRLSGSSGKERGK